MITSTGGANTGTGASGAGGDITFNTAAQPINLESTTITSAGGGQDDNGTVGNGGTVTFSDPVMLIGGTSAITTGANTNGNIDFDSTVNGAQALTLTAGSGNIAFDLAVGGTTPLGLVTINAANNVTISNAFSSNGFNQAATGTGTFDLDGLLTSTGAVIIDSATVDLDNSIAAIGKNVTVTSGAGGTNLASNFSVNTQSAVNTGTASGNIQFKSTTGNIVLDGDLISSGRSNTNRAGSNAGTILVQTQQAGDPIFIRGALTASGGNSTFAGADGGNAATITVTTNAGGVPSTPPRYFCWWRSW